METIRNRNCRITITVHNSKTGESYETRAFPSGAKPGFFSAPVGLQSGDRNQMHWVYITVKPEQARVVGGTKEATKNFKLRPVHESQVSLTGGRGEVEYTVKDQFIIQVRIVVDRADPSPGAGRPMSTSLAMEELLQKNTPRVRRPDSDTRTQSSRTASNSAKSFFRRLGLIS